MQPRRGRGVAPLGRISRQNRKENGACMNNRHYLLVFFILFFSLFTGHAATAFDSNQDGDVDGLDLLFFAGSFDSEQLANFAEVFGRNDFSVLPVDAEGWTNFETIIQTGYDDARVVFVSSSLGNDGNGKVYTISDLTFDSDGMFQPSGSVDAYATIAAGNANMRSGYPDILLLKREDEWVGERWATDSAGRAPSGRSSTERHIIASYGTGNRPQLYLNTGVGFDNDNSSYIVVSGLRFYADDWLESSRAIDVRGDSRDILFEDLKVDRHAGGIFQGGDLYNMVVRRCIFTEHEAHDGMFYAYKTTNMVFEENTFYKPYDDSYPDESRYGRIMYLNPGDGINLHGLDVKLRKNIYYSSERIGIDGRAGGIIDNNLLCRSDVRFGANGGSGGSFVSGSITNNVFTQTTDKMNMGSGLDVINAEDTVIQGNIFTDPGSQTREANAIIIMGDFSYDTFIARNINVIDNIVYGWASVSGDGRGIWFDRSLNNALINGVRNITIQDNDIQMVTGSTNTIFLASSVVPESSISGNRYFSTEPADSWFSPGGTYSGWLSATNETGSEIIEVSYPDPYRTIESYNVSLGGTSSTEAFMDEVLLQSRHNWRPEYTAAAFNNYIRAGFGKDSIE
jgi:hypothetical protein